MTIKTLTKILSASALALTFAGCAPDPTMAMRDGGLENSNYEVKRVAVFADDLAYQHRRGIYEIIDKRDGKITESYLKWKYLEDLKEMAQSKSTTFFVAPYDPKLIATMPQTVLPIEFNKAK
jgi:hypothetical protein